MDGIWYYELSELAQELEEYLDDPSIYDSNEDLGTTRQPSMDDYVIANAVALVLSECSSTKWLFLLVYLC